MSMPTGMAQWQADQWAQWAGLPAASRRAPAARPAAAVRERGVAVGRVIPAIVTVAIIAAALSLLPYRFDGEVRPQELTPIEQPLCTACPASQQITAAGVRSADGGHWLTVRFAAPPQGARFEVVTAAGAALTFAQRDDGRWALSVPDGTGVELPAFSVGARGDVAVFTLPAAAATGVAVRGVEGVRFPRAGSLPLHLEPARSIGVVDVLIAGVLVLGAWRGSRRGTRAAILQLASILIVFAIVRALRPFLSSGNLGVAATAVLYAGVVVGAGWIVFAALRWLVRARLGGDTPAAGALLGGVQVLLVSSMLLAVLSQQALVDGVSAAIERSSGAAALVSGWRALFQ